MAAHLLGLQRTIGNAAVARYVPNLEDSSVAPAPAPDVIRDSRDPRLRPAVPHLPRGAEVPGIVVCYAAGVDDLLDIEHHWIEMGDESYGWWPGEDVGASAGVGIGVPGVINGTTLPRTRGTATRDPHHGDPAQRFAVRVTTGDYPTDPAAATATAAARIRAFAHDFSGNYTWNPAGSDCHEFVEEALLAAGLEPRR